MRPPILSLHWTIRWKLVEVDNPARWLFRNTSDSRVFAFLRPLIIICIVKEYDGWNRFYFYLYRVCLVSHASNVQRRIFRVFGGRILDEEMCDFLVVVGAISYVRWCDQQPFCYWKTLSYRLFSGRAAEVYAFFRIFGYCYVFLYIVKIRFVDVDDGWCAINLPAIINIPYPLVTGTVSFYVILLPFQLGVDSGDFVI